MLVCVDDKAAATRIVELIKQSFPLTPVLARAFDRQHAIELLRHGVDYQMRETFESAMVFSLEVLRQLGVEATEAAAVGEDIRRRDAERLQMQLNGDAKAALALLHGNRWAPTPLTTPQREGHALNTAAEELIHGDAEPAAVSSSPLESKP